MGNTKLYSCLMKHLKMFFSQKIILNDLVLIFNVDDLILLLCRECFN